MTTRLELNFKLLGKSVNKIKHPPALGVYILYKAGFVSVADPMRNVS